MKRYFIILSLLFCASCQKPSLLNYYWNGIHAAKISSHSYGIFDTIPRPNYFIMSGMINIESHEKGIKIQFLPPINWADTANGNSLSRGKFYVKSLKDNYIILQEMEDGYLNGIAEELNSSLNIHGRYSSQSLEFSFGMYSSGGSSSYIIEVLE